MIGIIDYKAGNIRSVKNALDYLRIPNRYIANAKELDMVKKIILPGVGHFQSATQSLQDSGLWEALKSWILENKPFLGICLGLQLLFEGSKEAPGTEGFGIFKGYLLKFQAAKVPYIGWNQVKWEQDSTIIQGIPSRSYFYFVHSFYVPIQDNIPAIGIAEYEIPYIVATQKGNCIGVQFHPERSGENGLKLLKNWVNI